MPWSGGSYTLPSNSFNPAVSGATISATDWNATAADLENGVSEAIAKDGQSTTTAAIPFAQGVKLGAGTDVLSVYDSGTWTPTASFSTPGDLSVSYGTRGGEYVRIGDLVFVQFALAFTPTYTTASGNLTIGGLPINVSANSILRAAGSIRQAAAGLGGYSGYFLSIIPGDATHLVIAAFSSGVGGTGLSTTNAPSGTAQSISGSICYISA